MNRRLLLSGVLALAFMFLPGSPALAASTWYVNGVTGSDANACASAAAACQTIGHALTLASSGDTIEVAAATYPENLTITINVMIVGAGATTTIIDGGHVNTVVSIPNAPVKVLLSGLTIQNGATSGNGGGINNNGTLTLVSSTLSGNSASASGYGGGGGIYNSGTLSIFKSTLSGNSENGYGSGGGIGNTGTLTLNSSTLSGNSTNGPGYGSGGGGIENRGTLTVVASTFSANSETNGGSGGGIDNNGTLTVANSTFSGNSANVGYANGAGIANYRGTLAVVSSTFSGNSTCCGSIYNSSTVPTLQDTIVAQNPTGVNCYGSFTSNGYNLSSDGSCVFSGPGDLNNTDPRLGPLQNNGGPTQTQALLPGSPAIDAGNPAGCADSTGKLLTTDQRGRPRPDSEDAGVGCDIGAYERQTD
jgi:hypothetical protein